MSKRDRNVQVHAKCKCRSCVSATLMQTHSDILYRRPNNHIGVLKIYQTLGMHSSDILVIAKRFGDGPDTLKKIYRRPDPKLPTLP